MGAQLVGASGCPADRGFSVAPLGGIAEQRWHLRRAIGSKPRRPRAPGGGSKAAGGWSDLRRCAQRSAERQVYQRRALPSDGFGHAGRRGSNDSSRRASPCRNSPPPPPLPHSSAAHQYLPVVHCCAGESSGVPAQRRAVGAPAPGPVGARPARRLWWGGRKPPCGPHCGSAPQGGGAGQGGSSPGVGWVDLPGANAPGGCP